MITSTEPFRDPRRCKSAGLHELFFIAWFFPVILIAGLPLPASAQQGIRLSGTIVDSVNGRGLPFASLALTGCNLGTLSNEEGRFIFEFPGIMFSDTLAVACMGYRRRIIPVRSVSTGENVVLRLAPANYQLSEVEIVGLTPVEVIRKVVENIPQNYGVSPVVLTAFVRSQKFVDNRLAEYTEAVIENLKTGYGHYRARQEDDRKRQSNVPLLLRGRVISDTMLVGRMGEVGASAGCLGCNFIHDFAEFYRNTVLDESLFKYYTFRMEEVTGDGEKQYHIWFDQRKGVKKTLWKGEMYVNARDFALLSITQRPSFEAFDTFEKEKYERLYFIDGRVGWYREMPLLDWSVTYARRHQRYYLNSIRIANWLTFVYPSTGQRIRLGHKNEVIVTDAVTDSAVIAGFRGDKTIGVNQRWDQVAGMNDLQFWKNLNYLPMEEVLRETTKGIRPAEGNGQ